MKTVSTETLIYYFLKKNGDRREINVFSFCIAIYRAKPD